MKWDYWGHWGHWGCRGHWGCKGYKAWKITTDDCRVIQVPEFSFILMFWKQIFFVRIMKYQVEFWHLSSWRLLRPASLCQFFENWWMKLKCPNLFKPLGTIIQQNYWSFYPSEPFSFVHFNMIHPVLHSKNHDQKNHGKYIWHFISKLFGHTVRKQLFQHYGEKLLKIDGWNSNVQISWNHWAP
jgi:hypothetical protein